MSGSVMSVMLLLLLLLLLDIGWLVRMRRGRTLKLKSVSGVLKLLMELVLMLVVMSWVTGRWRGSRGRRMRGSGCGRSDRTRERINRSARSGRCAGVMMNRTLLLLGVTVERTV